MLMNIAPAGIIFLVMGIWLILIGRKKVNAETASIGGLLVGAGTMVLAVQFFYIFQTDDEGGGYSGTPISEALLATFLALGVMLIIVSILGWGTDRLFWRLFVRAHKA